MSQDTDNYTSDSTSQGSNNDDNMETGEEDATNDSGIQQFGG